MKRAFSVIAMILALTITAHAQAKIERTFKLTAGFPIGPTANPWIQEQGTGIKSHTIVWTTSGTVSTCSVKVEKSADGVSWSDMISGATCTSPAATGTITTDIANYVRVNATTLTGSGTLIVTYSGFTPGLPSSATISGDVTSATGTNFHVVVDSGGGGGSTAQGATTSGVTGGLQLACVTTAAPTYTTAQVNCPSLQTDGSQRVAVTNTVTVGSHAVTNAGTFATQATLTGAGTAGTPAGGVQSIQGVSSMTPIQVTSTVVDAAEGAAVATAPVPIGCVFRTTYTVLDAGDVGYPACDVNGRLIYSPFYGGVHKSGGTATAMTGTTSTSVIAGVSSNYLYIQSCSFSNDHASVSTYMSLQDGSGGTVIWAGYVPFGLGREVNWPMGLKVPTAGNGLFVANVTTGSSTKVYCQGYTTTVSY